MPNWRRVVTIAIPEMSLPGLTRQSILQKAFDEE
jgi:hypothetical protein